MKVRAIPQNLKPVLPVTAVYNLMRTQNAVREADKTQHDKTLKSAKDMLAQIALAVFSLKKQADGLPDSMRNTFVSLERALSSNGVMIVDYTGHEVTDELMERVSIEGWDTGTAAVELVQETFTPEVTWNGEILHMAQVFCSKAAAEGTKQQKNKKKRGLRGINICKMKKERGFKWQK